VNGGPLFPEPFPLGFRKRRKEEETKRETEKGESGSE
jgi:hypothetical protein